MLYSTRDIMAIYCLNWVNLGLSDDYDSDELESAILCKLQSMGIKAQVNQFGDWLIA